LRSKVQKSYWVLSTFLTSTSLVSFELFQSSKNYVYTFEVRCGRKRTRQGRRDWMMYESSQSSKYHLFIVYSLKHSQRVHRSSFIFECLQRLLTVSWVVRIVILELQSSSTMLTVYKLLTRQISSKQCFEWSNQTRIGPSTAPRSMGHLHCMARVTRK